MYVWYWNQNMYVSVSTGITACIIYNYSLYRLLERLHNQSTNMPITFNNYAQWIQQLCAVMTKLSSTDK